jgi:aminopeptidase N/puromycin-sensitive aminopeptidase
MSSLPTRFSLRSGVLAAILVAAGGLVTAAHGQRLSQAVRPEHYRLLLTPDLKTAKFTGNETIDVILAQASNSITLNADEITFHSVQATYAGGAPVAAQVALDPDKQQATFTFPSELPAGKVTLAIEYSGVLNNDLRGFYLSKTSKRNYAVTQFESTDARTAFPSFDEPEFKATFDVALTVDSADTVIANMNQISDRPAAPVDGAPKHTVAFATTPKMSTYLVAFLVGDFQCLSGESDGTPIRVCATPDKVEMGRFALSAAEYVLPYYNSYFGIKYPLPKLDMVALPDFEAGAMENFGAITYRETLLLVDDKTAALGQKKDVASVIAHEMAHQWFGDLVTMQWWDNIWLNEGFATWMAYKPVAAWHPEWHFSEQRAFDLNSTLNLDSRPTTHPIRAKADTPTEIREMFDGISYGKAGAVLAMVENYLGEQTFREGVHNYLAAHLYGNATAEDFWNAQTATSRKPVDKIMQSFVVQPGVPLLAFSGKGRATVEVTQTQFFLDGNGASNKDKLATPQLWTMPVCFKSDSKATCELLNSPSAKLKIPTSAFLFADAGGKGYYRSAYSKTDYQKIVAAAETSLTPAERIGVIGDQWALMRSGRATVGDYLDLVSTLRADPNPIVLQAELESIPAIETAIAATNEERDALHAWVRKEFSPVYAALGPMPAGKNGEPQEKAQIRALLFDVLGAAKDPTVVVEARSLTERYIADQTSVEPTLAQSAMRIAAANGDNALYDKLLALSASSPAPAVQMGALFTIAAFNNQALVTRTLDSVADGKVRNQDSLRLLAVLLRNRDTADQTWSYITQHWDKIQAQFPSDSAGRLMMATGSFCTAQKHDEVMDFVSTHQIKASERVLKSTSERIDSCVRLRAAQEPNLKQWLATQAVRDWTATNATTKAAN